MNNIFQTIREERQDFLNNEIEVVPGYTFSQYNTIKKIHLYYNSHYEKGDYETVNGVQRKKIFHNITSWRCEVATKMIDLDTKDFTLVSNTPEQDINVYLLERELKAWLKVNDMGKLLNQISETLPIYGSAVLQKTSDSAMLVDLRYLYNDPAAECLEDARYILKKNFLSHQDLRKMAKKGWEHVNEAIDLFSGKYRMGYDLNGVQQTNMGSNVYYEGAGSQSAKTKNAPLVEIFERYGQVPLSWFTDREKDDSEYVLAKYICCGIDEVSKNDDGAILEEGGLVLYKEQIDELPFKEVHYKKTPGRWLGIGIVETLFENQRRINEIKNQEARALELGSMQVFQTKDATVASNILTDIENGEIKVVKSEITPIPTESREMGGFASVAENIEQHSDSLTFSRDVVSGETPPATATLGAVQIETAQTTAVFDYKKENIGLFLQEFIEDLVFPQIEKELNREHVLRLTDSLDEILRLRKNYAMNCANQDMVQAVLNDQDPSQELWDSFFTRYMGQVSAMGNKIWTQVQKNFFKNLDYYVDVVITNENKNVFSQIQNGQAILGLLEKDPTVLQDPAKKKIVFKILAGMGMHLSELEDIESSSQQPNLQQNVQQTGQPGQGGGGLPQPAAQVLQPIH